jgi:DNA processing protein
MNLSLESRLRLIACEGLGPVLIARLALHFGTPQAACEATESQLRNVEGIGPKRASAICRQLGDADPQAEWDAAAAAGVAILDIDDPQYPMSLRSIHDPPPVLFVRGELDVGDALSLAIVGSRAATAYGREQADRIAYSCATAGLTIVSGGALGIDAAAHRGVLRAEGRTLAVVGSGLHHCYPAEHRILYDAIVSGHGAVISELPMDREPAPENFPRRNRIISGLSLGVLVVEADHRSGALITARLAAEEHHREVLALPGRVDSPASRGCHRMIREGWAQLVTGPADVLEELGEAGQKLKASMDGLDSKPQLDTGATQLGTEQKTVLEAVGAGPTNIDHLSQSTGLGIPAIQGHLTLLQIYGLIERLPANCVRRRT